MDLADLLLLAVDSALVLKRKGPTKTRREGKLVTVTLAEHPVGKWSEQSDCHLMPSYARLFQIIFLYNLFDQVCGLGRS